VLRLQNLGLQAIIHAMEGVSKDYDGAFRELEGALHFAEAGQ